MDAVWISRDVGSAETSLENAEVVLVNVVIVVQHGGKTRWVVLNDASACQTRLESTEVFLIDVAILIHIA